MTFKITKAENGFILNSYSYDEDTDDIEFISNDIEGIFARIKLELAASNVKA